MSEGRESFESIPYALDREFAKGKVTAFKSGTEEKNLSTRVNIETSDGSIQINRRFRPYSRLHGEIVLNSNSGKVSRLQIHKPSKTGQVYDFYDDEVLVGSAQGRLFDHLIAAHFVEIIDPSLLRVAEGNKVGPEVITHIAASLAQTPVPSST